MAYRKKSNTNLTPDQILDTAADILETSGWVTERCYDSATGGHCAIGAVARAVYPKAEGYELERLAFVNHADVTYLVANERAKDPRHVTALEYLGGAVLNRKTPLIVDTKHEPVSVTYLFNDCLADETDAQRKKSSKRVVNKLRKAAELYRSKQAA